MKILLLTVFMWSFVACKTSDHKEFIIPEIKEAAMPANWKLITACQIHFSVPFDFKEEKVKPIDSCVKRYGNENIRITLDVLEGMSSPESNYSRSNEYSNRNDFKLEKTSIDGQQAEIITFSGAGMDLDAKGLDYGVVLDVPQMNFTMWAYGRSLREIENVKKIFQSVRFSK